MQIDEYVKMHLEGATDKERKFAMLSILCLML